MDDDPGPGSMWALLIPFGAAVTPEIDGLRIFIELLIVIGCGIFSAFFSGSEVSILSVNRIRLLELREEGSRPAGILLDILEQPNQIISSLLVANTTVNVMMAFIWTDILMTLSETYNLHEQTLAGGINAGTGLLTAGGLFITAILILFSEVLPKNMFHRNPEFYALRMAGFLQNTIFIFKPLVWLTFNISRIILKIFGVTISSEAAPITEEEIIDLIETGEEEGFIQEQERDMIHSIFEFGDLRVRDVMVPRVDMDAVSKNATITQALQLIVETGHSRVPVYGKNRDEIIGLVYAKDLLGRLGDDDISEVQLVEIMREVEFVPEEMQISTLFGRMKKHKTHFAIVADEYGGTAGLVTIEDVLEEIVGEIEDEYDTDAPLFREEKGVWIVDGKLNLHDLEDLIEIEFPENGADTVGGLIYQHLGRIPNEGDQVVYTGTVFRVLKVDNQRITEIEVKKLSKDIPDELMGNPT